MNRLIFSFFILIQGFSWISQPLPKPVKVTIQPTSAVSLCPPGVYRVDPQDCLPLGPSGFLTQLASEGISLPLISLPAHPVDPVLGELPYNYALLGEGQTKLYASLDDAEAGRNV